MLTLSCCNRCRCRSGMQRTSGSRGVNGCHISPNSGTGIDLNNLTIPKKSRVTSTCSPNEKTDFSSAIPKKRAATVLEQSLVAVLDCKIPKKNKIEIHILSKEENKRERAQHRNKDEKNNSRKPAFESLHRERTDKDAVHAKQTHGETKTKLLKQKPLGKKKRPRDEVLKPKVAMQEEEGPSQQQMEVNGALHTKTVTTKKRPRKRKSPIENIEVVEERKALKRGFKCIKQKQNSKVSHQTTNEVRQLPQNTDVYPKHRRELERSLDRLEKSDQFGFFLDYPETDDDSERKIYSGSIGLDLGLSRSKSRAVASLLTTGPSQTEEVASSNECISRLGDNCGASLPPKSFSEVREWVKRGRYEADRQFIQNIKASRLAKKLGKDVTDLIGIDAIFNVPNSKSVDWETFRDDIYSMCDTAITDDLCGSEGKSGTLGHTAVKLREVSLVI